MNEATGEKFNYELQQEVEDLQAQLAAVTAERDAFKRNYTALREMFDLNPAALYARLEQAERECASRLQRAENDAAKKDEALRRIRHIAWEADVTLGHSPACNELPFGCYAPDCDNLKCVMLREVDAALNAEAKHGKTN